MDDQYDLERFVSAQSTTYDHALAELRRGQKTSHWMWFIFPQVAGLGRSEISRQYAICSLNEAQAYLAHPVLGPRLVECATVLAHTQGKTAVEIMGQVDAQKLRSCMTLFMRAAPRQEVFARVLGHYFPAGADPATDERLGEHGRL